MKGIIGKKIGMTSIFDNGKSIAVTIVEAGPCVVSQIKTTEKEGYNSTQLAFDDKKEKNTSAGEAGHLKKANATPKRKLVEFRDADLGKNIGDIVDVTIFNEGEKVDIIGTSKGKGFQGVVKRHGFSGVGMGSHGQHDRQRAPGSIGASSYPSRVFKGMRMAGRLGGDRTKIKDVSIIKIMAERNLLLVKGSIPGANNSYVIIEK